MALCQMNILKVKDYISNGIKYLIPREKIKDKKIKLTLNGYSRRKIFEVFNNDYCLNVHKDNFTCSKIFGKPVNGF